MSKWAVVECSCVNRVKLPGGDWTDQPHQKKHRLTKAEQKEVDDWKRERQDAFACGHRGGLVAELWPGLILQVAGLVGAMPPEERANFQIFCRIADRQQWLDSTLLLSPDDAPLWLLEIEELGRLLDDPAEVVRIAAQGFMLRPTLLYADGEVEPATIEAALVELRAGLERAALLAKASVAAQTPVRLMR